MLHAGLDLSRRRLDYCCSTRRATASRPARRRRTATVCAGLVGWPAASRARSVRAAIESMNGARFVHDTLERCGWEVEIADAQKVKGLAPLACKTDRIDAWVLAELSRRDLVPAIWLPDFEQRAERERARCRLFWSSTARAEAPHPCPAAGVRPPCPVTDLFGVGGRELLERLDFPDPGAASTGGARADR